MYIQALKLDDFRSHADTHVEFAQGTTAIVGENGAGKSSLLDAIGLALFDYRPEGLTFERLLREGSSSGSIVVTVQFGREPHPFEVERAFSARATTRYRVYDVLNDRAVVAEGNDEVTSWLRRQLAVDEETSLRDLFANTIGVPQGTLTAPFLLPAGGRRDVFEPLLRVNEFRRSADNLRDVSSALIGQRQALERQIAQLDGELSQRASLLDEHDLLVASTEERQERIARDATAHAELAARLAELDALAERVRTAERDFERARSTVQVQSGRVETARRALDEAIEAADQVSASAQGHQAYLDAEERLGQLEVRRQARDTLRQRVGALDTKRAGLETQLRHQREDLHKLQDAHIRVGSLAPAARKYATLRAQALDLQNELGRLSAARARASSLAENLAEAQRRVIEAEAARQSSQDLEGKINAVEEAIESARQRETQVGRELTRAQDAIAAIREQNASLEAAEGSPTCPLCESALTEEHLAELLERNANELERLIRVVDQQIKARRGAAADRARCERELGRLRAALTQAIAASDVERAKERREALESELAQAKEETSELVVVHSRVDACQRQLASLEDSVKEYQGLQKTIEALAMMPERVQASEAALANTEKALEAMLSEMAVYEGLDSEVRAVRQQQKRHRDAHDTYLRYHAIAQQREARAKALRQADESLASVSQHADQARTAYEKLAAGLEREEHQRVRDAERKLASDLASAQATQEAEEKRLRAVRNRLKHLLRVEEERNATVSERDEIEALANLLEEVRSLLRAAGPHMTRQLVRKVSVEARAIYADIMEDPASRLEWSEDYEISLDVKGRQRGFRQFSGGEQMTAAMAVRLALLRTASNVDIAFFDEPTAHLDTTRRDGLAERITQVRGFSQMFVISHDDTFEQSAQSYLRVTKDESGSHVEVI